MRPTRHAGTQNPARRRVQIGTPAFTNRHASTYKSARWHVQACTQASQTGAPARTSRHRARATRHAGTYKSACGNVELGTLTYRSGRRCVQLARQRVQISTQARSNRRAGPYTSARGHIQIGALARANRHAGTFIPAGSGRAPAWPSQAPVWFLPYCVLAEWAKDVAGGPVELVQARASLCEAQKAFVPPSSG